jgi:serine/threonine protein kinase
LSYDLEQLGTIVRSARNLKSTMNIVLAPGARIAERYELLQLIGEGGMGSVWKARHLALEAPVAIKFVRVDGLDPERFHARFQREAKLAASVRHRNVVSITDYGRMGDGAAFMVMDFLEGEALSRYLRVRPPAAEMVYLVELTTRGLVAVHDAGIVHRDLKPENIFLVRDATGVYPKLIDFGISKHMRPEGERRSAVTTTDGAIVGTPAYMSPEQARGLLDLDQRTDIYSMGVILYEGLAGHLPYDSPYVGDLILAIVMGGAKPLHELRPDLDPRLCDVVMKAMAQDASQRYQSARELLQALSVVAPISDEMLRSDRPPSNVSGRLAVPFAPRPSPGAPATSLEAGGALRSGPAAGVEHGEIDLAAAGTDVVVPVWPSRKMLFGGAALAISLAILSAGVWLGVQRTRNQRTQEVAPAEAPAVATPEPVASPEQPGAASVSLELFGLPERASLALDGRTVVGTRFYIPRDDREHTIRATADGFEPWSHTFLASRDLRVDVSMKAIKVEPPVGPEPKPVASKPRPPASVQPQQPVRPTPKPAEGGQSGGRPKRVITELDY